MTKNVFGKVVSKSIPIVGGAVSGGITFATLRPMGFRLVEALDDAKFSYTQDNLDSDWIEIQKTMDSPEKASCSEEKSDSISISEEIKKNKELLDDGIITEEEFNEIKKRLIEKL